MVFLSMDSLGVGVCEKDNYLLWKELVGLGYFVKGIGEVFWLDGGFFEYVESRCIVWVNVYFF